ncbi:MAG: nucleotide-binding protein [Chloroflexi bacterium]|nr:nucleotide-binding protein [Chloroflexota bacterium]
MAVSGESARALIEFRKRLRYNVEVHFSNANLVEGNRALQEWTGSFLGFVSAHIPDRLEEAKQQLLNKTIERNPKDAGLPTLTIYENQIGAWLHSYIEGLLQEITNGHTDMTTMDSALKKNVFIVHGRNDKIAESMFDFLRAIELKPMEWAYAIQLMGTPTPFIKDILDVAFANAQAVVVLLTPDEMGHLKEEFQKRGDPPYDLTPTGQARLNVIFEAGMALATHPDRTILVECGDIRPFSDISGIHVVKMSNSSERRFDLVERLKQAKCEPNIEGNRRWLKVGNFEL